MGVEQLFEMQSIAAVMKNSTMNENYTMNKNDIVNEDDTVNKNETMLEILINPYLFQLKFSSYLPGIGKGTVTGAALGLLLGECATAAATLAVA